MRTIGAVVVTVGFVWLLGQVFARQVPPVVVIGYAAVFVGWELYAQCARDEARSRRRKREASGLCLCCGYDLSGSASNVCPECGDGARTDPTTAAFHDLLAASAALAGRVERFRGRPFPTGWSAAVNGVALASFTLDVERSLERLSRLPRLCRFELPELQADGEPQATAAALHADLHPLLRRLDQFLPALPAEAQIYFGDLRAIMADAVALLEEWWECGAGGREHPVRHE